MKFHAHTALRWQIILLGVMFALWLGLFTVLIIARGDLEAFLQETFRHNSRRDAFNYLNRVSNVFLVVHASLTITAVAAARPRRSDVFAVLLTGPAIGLMISLRFQRWSDPNWHDFVAVSLIGWLVGMTVGVGYWFLSRPRHA
jgi:hypothetical protein